MQLSNKTILLLIILLAAVLRFYKFPEIPFTHDEFSALFRTHFNSFSDLIEEGVKTDGHPAGIQVFLYYWTKLFGYSEWIVKIPFTIFGLLSVYLIFLIARDWYNETVALISASFLASIQYTIMYSQIARPYISGMFFSLLMVFFWTKIVLRPQQQFYLNSVFFIIAASLCTYNHHFSLLFAFIVGLSGLFFIQRQYLLKYIISGILIILLYLPHIKIFLYQLNMGGVGGWLGKPHNDFIINYIGYIFNYSAISLGIVLLLMVFGFFRIKRKDVNFKYLLLFTCWFILPFLIGFFYSKYVNGVLQYSVLIFNFPFLFFVLFGHIQSQKVKINLIIVITIFAVNIFSLITERQHYKLFYQSSCEQILVDHQKAINSNASIISIIDSHKRISDYYITKNKFDTTFIWFDSFKTEKDFIVFLKKQSQLYNYLYFGCVSGNNPISVPIIQDYYPALEWQHDYAGATTYLFSKAKPKEVNIIAELDFESKNNKSWSSIDNEKYCDTIHFSGKSSYLIDNKTEWCPTYTRIFKGIISNKNDFIDISVKTHIPEKSNDIILVTSLESKGKNVYWNDIPFDKFIINEAAKDKWITIHHSMKLSDIYLNYRDMQLKIFIWNKGKQSFYIDDFIIQLRKGNSVIYGLYEKI